MTVRKWSDIRAAKGAPPRLTDDRLAEIVGYKEVAGNISAAMADEILAELRLQKSFVVMAHAELEYARAELTGREPAQ